MRTPREIYKEFKIMPNLQLHQLRVAAVGKLVCEHFEGPINTSDVVLACLFHDMGNIVKFRLDRFPEFFGPEGLEYWEKVKADVVQRYGQDQHEVSKRMAQEIGLSEYVVEMIGAAGFSQIPAILAGDSTELKLLQYADLRVAPTGVVSLQERLDDFERRYAPQKDSPEEIQAAKDLEQHVISRCSMRSKDITDAAVAPLVEELWEYPVT